jgi:DNA repair protein RadC
MKSVKEWPALERPRGRLLSQKVGVLSDAELLAVILRRGKDGIAAFERSLYK